MRAQALTCGRVRCDPPAVAAKSATGFDRPKSKGAQAPHASQRRFFHARDSGVACARPFNGGPCVGVRKGCRFPLGRSVNPRTVRHPAIDSAVADSNPKGARTMNTRTPAATAASTNVPRPQWAGLLQHAAMALEGRAIFDSESLAAELRAIAAALRAEVTA